MYIIDKINVETKGKSHLIVDSGTCIVPKDSTVDFNVGNLVIKMHIQEGEQNAYKINNDEETLTIDVDVVTGADFSSTTENIDIAHDENCTISLSFSIKQLDKSNFLLLYTWYESNNK